MELDHLKEIWKSHPATGGAVLSNEQLLSMVNHPSKSPVAIMKRNLRKELRMVVISFSLAAVVFFFLDGGKMAAFAWVYIFLMIVFFFYYYFKNKLLSSMQCVTCEVRSNLTLQLDSLEKYIRKNLLYSTLTFPAFLMLGALIMYLDYDTAAQKAMIFYSSSYPAWQTTLLWLGISVFLTIPMYFLNKKYLYWLYGKHIDRLRKVVGNMEID